MRTIFLQTAEHCITGAFNAGLLEDLPKVIHQHTGLSYAYQQTDGGCFLKPVFRNMPYRNSFFPEIRICVSHNADQTLLHMTGQPVKFVRGFMRFWFGFLFMLEAFLLMILLISGMDSLFPFFVPVIMCVFGYFLCKIGTQTPFCSVVKAIEKGYP